MGKKKKPLGMSELGCADGCGRRACKGVGRNGWGKKAAGDERAWLRGRQRTGWVQGSGWKCGEKMLGMKRAWLRGRLRTAWVQGVAGNKWGEEAAGNERAWLCGRLRTAWSQGGG